MAGTSYTGCLSSCYLHSHSELRLHLTLVSKTGVIFGFWDATDESISIVVYLVFRFITGFCGSTFLSVAGGSVSDLFDNKTVAKSVFSTDNLCNSTLIISHSPMAVYTISPFIGPVVGPLLSG